MTEAVIYTCLLTVQFPDSTLGAVDAPPDVTPGASTPDPAVSTAAGGTEAPILAKGTIIPEGFVQPPPGVYPRLKTARRHGRLFLYMQTKPEHPRRMKHADLATLVNTLATEAAGLKAAAKRKPGRPPKDPMPADLAAEGLAFESEEAFSRWENGMLMRLLTKGGTGLQGQLAVLREVRTMRKDRRTGDPAATFETLMRIGVRMNELLAIAEIGEIHGFKVPAVGALNGQVASLVPGANSRQAAGRPPSFDAEAAP